MRDQNSSDAEDGGAKGVVSSARRAIRSAIGAGIAGAALAIVAVVAFGDTALSHWRDAFFAARDHLSGSAIAVDGYRAGTLISNDELVRLGKGMREKGEEEDRMHAARLEALDAKLHDAQERLKLEDPAARFGPEFAVQPPAEAP